MIVPTAPALESRRIVDQACPVPGEAAMGASIVGGRRAPAKVLKDARDVAIGEMTNEAAARGANAVVSVDVDYEVLGEGLDAHGVGQRDGGGGVGGVAAAVVVGRSLCIDIL